MSRCEWAAAPAHLTLPPDEVHVWRAILDVPQAQLQSLRAALSQDELERAARFRFAYHRDHYIAARGQLRVLLSRYLGIMPGQIAFSYSDYGKPALAAVSDLRFNLSHSRDLVLYAFTRGREIGVDVEWIDTSFVSAEIAAHYFSANEHRALMAQPEHLRPALFFTCWTRKEAYIKAHGAGLSFPLHAFDVAFQPGEAPRLLANRHSPSEVGRWSLCEIIPHPDYKAALAVEGEGWHLRCWQW